MGAPLLTVAEVRAVLGSKAEGMTDADLEAIARRIREVSVTVLEIVRQPSTAAR